MVNLDMTRPEVHYARLTAVLIYCSEAIHPNRLCLLLIIASLSIYAVVQQGHPD